MIPRVPRRTGQWPESHRRCYGRLYFRPERWEVDAR